MLALVEEVGLHVVLGREEGRDRQPDVHVLLRPLPARAGNAANGVRAAWGGKEQQGGGRTRWREVRGCGAKNCGRRAAPHLRCLLPMMILYIRTRTRRCRRSRARWTSPDLGGLRPCWDTVALGRRAVLRRERRATLRRRGAADGEEPAGGATEHARRSGEGARRRRRFFRCEPGELDASRTMAFTVTPMGHAALVALPPLLLGHAALVTPRSRNSLDYLVRVQRAGALARPDAGCAGSLSSHTVRAARWSGAILLCTILQFSDAPRLLSHAASVVHNGQAAFCYSRGCFIGCAECSHGDGRRQVDLCSGGATRTIDPRAVNLNSTPGSGGHLPAQPVGGARHGAGRRRVRPRRRDAVAPRGVGGRRLHQRHDAAAGLPDAPRPQRHAAAADGHRRAVEDRRRRRGDVHDREQPRRRLRVPAVPGGRAAHRGVLHAPPPRI